MFKASYPHFAILAKGGAHAYGHVYLDIMTLVPHSIVEIYVENF